MDTTDSPLTDLYVDNAEIEAQQLKEILDGVLGIDETTGELVFFESYYETSDRSRLIYQLLGRLAAVHLGDRESAEQGATAETLAEPLDVTGRSVQNYADNFVFIIHDEERGGYLVDSAQLQTAVETLQGRTTKTNGATDDE